MKLIYILMLLLWPLWLPILIVLTAWDIALGVRHGLGTWL